MKKILFILFTYCVIPIFGQDNYGLKEVTITLNDDCLEKLKECKNEVCWLTRFSHDGSYFQGIGYWHGGCHNVWIKEVKYYNSNDSLIAEFIDEVPSINFIKKASLNKVKEYVNENNKWIIYNYKSKYNLDTIRFPYFIYHDSLILK